jgi:hypothetical protein
LPLVSLGPKGLLKWVVSEQVQWEVSALCSSTSQGPRDMMSPEQLLYRPLVLSSLASVFPPQVCRLIVVPQRFRWNLYHCHYYSVLCFRRLRELGVLVLQAALEFQELGVLLLQAGLLNFRTLSLQEEQTGRS